MIKTPHDLQARLQRLVTTCSGRPSRQKLATELNQLADELEKSAAAHGGPVERIREALDNLTYLTNAVASWVDAHAGNRDLAKSNGRKVKQAEDLLAEVLASMPSSIRYTVYGLEDEGVRGPYKSVDDLIDALKRVGITQSGYSSTTGRLRPELQGQPTFKGLVGPMFDGPGVARYETGETYDRLSR